MADGFEPAAFELASASTLRHFSLADLIAYSHNLTKEHESLLFNHNMWKTRAERYEKELEALLNTPNHHRSLASGMHASNNVEVARNSIGAVKSSSAGAQAGASRIKNETTEDAASSSWVRATRGPSNFQASVSRATDANLNRNNDYLDSPGLWGTVDRRQRRTASSSDDDLFESDDDSKPKGGRSRSAPKDSTAGPQAPDGGFGSNLQNQALAPSINQPTPRSEGASTLFGYAPKRSALQAGLDSQSGDKPSPKPQSSIEQEKGSQGLWGNIATSTPTHSTPPSTTQDPAAATLLRPLPSSTGSSSFGGGIGERFPPPIPLRRGSSSRGRAYRGGSRGNWPWGAE
ncbi:MAG: hypothetical protein Q9169_005108 [Polycauliona sp. 2 TL-2023]